MLRFANEGLPYYVKEIVSKNLQFFVLCMYKQKEQEAGASINGYISQKKNYVQFANKMFAV